MKDVVLVTATRRSREEFRRHAALFPSRRRLRALPRARISSRIAYRNRLGLSAVYNRHLHPRNADKILVFVHDDVSIQDLFFLEKLDLALRTFDVVGVAGNRAPGARNVSWHDRRQPLAGCVAHAPRGAAILSRPDEVVVSSYGPTPGACRLLDGLLLAVNTERVLRCEARFDERFGFHFYDLDFCRTCAARGLRLGTWPLWVVHESGGALDSPAWREAAALYRSKWKIGPRSRS